MSLLLPFLFCVGIPLFFAVAKYLKDLEVRLAGWLFGSLAVGGVAGALYVMASRESRPALRLPILVVVVAAGALWLFRREHAPDAFEGLLRGGLFASGAAVPLALETDRPFGTIAVVLVAALAAGAVASWMSDAASRAATAAFVVTAAGIAAAATASAAQVVEPMTLAWMVGLGAGIAAAASPFLLFPGVAEELQAESELGVIPPALVPRVSRPLARFSRGGLEPEAHRRITQLAWRLALRLRRQRSTGLAESRLHQVEILKLRQELGALLRATHEIASAGEADVPPVQSSAKGARNE
ncbi:MAG TPA: hypothetical protein VGF40_04945 [Thermoanaerobaculia bacterium]